MASMRKVVNRGRMTKLEPTVPTDWTRATCLKFIKQVESHECLWNRNAPGYRNVMMVLNAWISMAKEFGVNYKMLRNKWRSLQGSFRQVNRQYQTANGDSPPDWFAYDAMQFLKNQTPDYESLVEIGLPQPEIEVKNLSEPSSRAESPAPGPSTQASSIASPLQLRIVDPRSILSQQPTSIALKHPTPPQSRSQAIRKETTQPAQPRSRTMKRRLEDTTLPYNRNMLKVLENVSAVTDRLVEERQTAKSEGEVFGEWVGGLLDEWSPDRRQSAKVAIRRFLAKKDAARFRERVGKKVEKMYESSDSDV